VTGLRTDAFPPEKKGLVQVAERPSELGPPRRFYAFCDDLIKDSSTYADRYQRSVTDVPE
jgi:hypothetical protein